MAFCLGVNYHQYTNVYGFSFLRIYLKNYFKVNNDVHNYNTRQRRNIHPNKTYLVLGGGGGANF